MEKNRENHDQESWHQNHEPKDVDYYSRHINLHLSNI